MKREDILSQPCADRASQLRPETNAELAAEWSVITKRKDPNGWRLFIDGKPTELFVSKGDPPRYREPQTYNLWTGDFIHLIEAPSVGGLIDRLETLLAAINKAEGR